MKSGRFVGPDRAEVVGNIRRAVAAKAFNIKVEEHDPVFSKSEEQRIVTHYLQQRQDKLFKLKTLVCRLVVNAYALQVTKDVEVVGVDKIRGIKSGGVITSNHCQSGYKLGNERAARLCDEL